MSFSDFKEVNINNPGTATVYGADDILEIMRIFNAKTVSNRKVQIKNPWEWQESFDVKAAAVTPSNPGANTKRIYVEPSNNHLIVKSSAGTTIDIDVLGQGAVGEANTTSNGGTGGVGIVLPKDAVNLPFKSIAGGSNKITVTDDATNKNVDIDVAEANLTLNNIGGILNVAHGGTGLNTITTQALLKGAGTGNMVPITPGTNGYILTMVAGAPAWAAQSGSTDIRVAAYEAGTQIGSVGRKLNFTNADDFDIAEDGANDRFDLSLRRSEALVGSWLSPSGTTLTNVGTSYVDVYTSSANEGNGCDLDGTGKNNFRLYVSWSKNFGSGTHSLQVKDQVTSDVLATIADLTSGRNVATGTIPTYFQDNVRSVKLQAKSTVSTDDPIIRGAHIWYK